MSKLVYIASPFSKIWDKEFAVLLAEKACDEVAKMARRKSSTLRCG